MSRGEEGMPSVGDIRRDEGEAVLSQPGLREKRAHFELMRRLGKEGDESDESQSDEGGEGEGSKGARRRDRERCMRFFLGCGGGDLGGGGGKGKGQVEGGGVSGGRGTSGSAPLVRGRSEAALSGRGKNETISVVHEQKDMAPVRGQNETAPVPPPTEAASMTHGQRKNTPIASHHTPANGPTTTTTKQNHQTRHLPRKDTSSTAQIIQATHPDNYSRRLKPPRDLPDPANETIIPDTTRATKTHPRRPQTPLPLSKHINSSTPIQSQPQPKKRKRNSSTILRLRPENERIFTDLHFYYIPNDDIAPLRKLRIGKAREYGATWTRDVSAATHVIVDKGIPYRDVKKVLGEEAQGRKAERGPVVVNEDYPVDCIQFKALLDHGQMKYGIPGQGVGETCTGGNGAGGTMESGDSVGGRTRKGMSRGEDHVEDVAGPLKGNGILGGGNAAEEGGEGAGGAALTESHPTNGALNGGITGGKESNNEHEQKHGSDELSQYIKIMQEYKDLPLEHEDEDTELLSAAGDPPEPHAQHSGDDKENDKEESRSDSDTEQPGHKTRTKKKLRRAEDQFACHRAGAQFADANNPNAPTIAVLQRMADYYNRTNDHWRTTSYRKAISTLKQHKIKVTSEAQAVQLPHIGQSLAQKIQEIATTNNLRRLNYAEQSTDEEPMQSSAYQLFLQIHGVGTHQAQQWLSHGHRTLEDLKAKAKLTPAQRIGIDHFDDLNRRIPRHEVAALGAYVQKAAAKIDPSVELIIGGSYRRGAPTSGDIDFIVTKGGTTCVEDLRPFFGELLGVLTRGGFLTASLASSFRGGAGTGGGGLDVDVKEKEIRGEEEEASFSVERALLSSSSSGSGRKFHGCCVLPRGGEREGDGDGDAEGAPIWRRIDFLLVPETERGAALIYFTGNDIFNRSMRLLARRKGMRLNDKGLWGRGDTKVGKGVRAGGELVEGRCERRIFEILGVQWREPTERWC
ncbi:hypothetical protein E4U57_006534 [Claviceps arundinis]|uniref:DNA polymerase lambda n=1 Tax=Claviceps arundinis TaxID=1623583 RepID=A0ABQ7PIF6_9HYPO|nr:hypothetical protein E4U57_006534 [Claviceps arundinis]